MLESGLVTKPHEPPRPRPLQTIDVLESTAVLDTVKASGGHGFLNGGLEGKSAAHVTEAPRQLGPDPHRGKAMK